MTDDSTNADGSHGADGAPNADSTSDDEGRWRSSLLVPAAIIAIAIGLIGAIVLLAQQEQGQGEAALATVSVDSAGLPVTVPYREVAGSLVIDATFGDHSRTVPMILDTGAPTIISEELAQVFAPDAVGTIAATSADGRVTTSDVVRLPQLSIGGAQFSDVAAVVGAIEPGNPLYCVTDSGFIGASLMQAAAWQIDPRTNTVTIAASLGQLPETLAVGIPFTRASAIAPSPLIGIDAGTGTLPFVVDTGSDGWIAASLEDLASAGISLGGRPPTVTTIALGASGPAAAREQWTSAEMKLGAESATLPLATSEILPPGQGSLGTDLLSHFVVTLDWTNDMVYLEPITDAATRSPSIPMSATLSWDDGFTVGSIVEGLAETDPLELGANVVAIDGRDVTTAPFDDFCKRTLAAPTPHTITVAGDTPSTVEAAPVEDFFAHLEG
jgi:predicted aspartyl protease